MIRGEHLKLAARIGVTLALAGLLAWQLDLRYLAGLVRGMAWPGALAAFALVFLAIGVSAWKWGLILAARGHRMPLGRLLRLYFIGLFFNNVMPTAVGGDAVRAWEATRETGEVPEAVGSVLSERLIAGVALGCTALLGLPFMTADAGADDHTLRWVLVFLVIDLALVGLFLVPRVAEGIAAKLMPRRLDSAGATVARTVRVVGETLRSPRLVAAVFLLSVLFQVCVAGVNAAIFHALGVPVTLAQCIVYTPMIFTVAMLPISISGFGVREAAYWYFFSRVGVNEAAAIATSLLFFLIVALCSLPGALFFMFRRRTRASRHATEAPGP